MIILNVLNVTVAIEIPGGKRNLNMNINAQQVNLNAYTQTIQVYIKFNLLTLRRYIATSSELSSLSNLF